MGILNSISNKNKDASESNSIEKTLAKIQVKDIMSKKLITTPYSTTVYQISKMMEQGIGAVLVKKDSATVGIITDRDFAIKIVANKYPLDTPVEKIASFPLQMIGPNESILDAANQMSSKKIRKLAVSENNIIVGIITSSDIVKQLARIKK